MVFENWVDVLVNGELIQRFMVPQGRSEFCLFRGMDRSKARRVQIVRDTQAMHLDARNSLAICSVRTDGVFEEVPQPSLRLEFIGDSLTSGEGLTGAGDYLEWNPGCFSAIHSYAFRTAQMLGAECSILSQSGWGTCFSGRQCLSTTIRSAAFCGETATDREAHSQIGILTAGNRTR